MLITALLIFSCLVSFTVGASQQKVTNNRPLIHHTPDHGWMNDPNGMFYDRKDKVWHLYYQYNPNGSTWDLPLYWGHSTLKDLTTWDFHGAVLSPDHDDEGIFSGSIIVDYNNTSGFFNDSTHPDQRVVAIYTNNTPDSETQDLAYSTDGGYTFTKYENNPVLDVNSTQFRDPKAFWHEESQQWIVLLAKSQEYKLQIFGSKNLKDWTLHSNFTGGYPGFQYECPGLLKVPLKNSTESKWVMFLAINPGAPNGGSLNEYFIGDFDGYTFKPQDNMSRFVDFGKDFYALQTFDNVLKEDGVLGMAWASNWQYANKVPTHPWRSSNSLVRNFTLDYVSANPETTMLSLLQSPVFEASETRSMIKENYSIRTNNSFALNASNKNKTGALFDFDITLKVDEGDLTKLTEANFEVVISSADKKERVKIGYDPVGQAFYMDRGIKHKEFSSPLFTDKISTYVEHMYTDSKDLKVYKIYGVVDENIVDLFFNDGATTMTNTFFMNEGNSPSLLEVSTNIDGVFFIEKAVLRELSV